LKHHETEKYFFEGDVHRKIFGYHHQSPLSTAIELLYAFSMFALITSVIIIYFIYFVFCTAILGHPFEG